MLSHRAALGLTPKGYKAGTVRKEKAKIKLAKAKADLP